MDLYGSPQAFQQAIIDHQNVQMNNLAIQRDQVGLASDRLKLSQMQAMTAALERMQTQASGSAPGNVADNLESVANSILPYEPEKAGKMFQEASTIRHNEQLVTSGKLKDSQAQMKAADQIIQGVPDTEEGWQIARDLAHEEGLDNDPGVKKILDMPYTPANPLTGQKSIIGVIKDTLTSELQKARIQSAIAQQKRDDAYVKSQPLRDAYTKAATERQRDLVRRAAKNGGVGAPKPATVKAAKDWILKDHGAIHDADANYVNLKANDIAARAEEIVAQTHMNFNQAVAKAYNELKDTINLPPSRRGPGATAEKPRDLPSDFDKTKISQQLIPDQYYKFPTGTYYWDGENLIRPSDAQTEPEGANDDTEEDDEE